MNAVNNNLRNLNKLNTMNNITSTRKRNYDDSLDNSLNSNNMDLYHSFFGVELSSRIFFLIPLEE